MANLSTFCHLTLDVSRVSEVRIEYCLPWPLWKCLIRPPRLFAVSCNYIVLVLHFRRFNPNLTASLGSNRTQQPNKIEEVTPVTSTMYSFTKNVRNVSGVDSFAENIINSTNNDYMIAN